MKAVFTLRLLMLLALLMLVKMNELTDVESSEQITNSTFSRESTLNTPSIVAPSTQTKKKEFRLISILHKSRKEALKGGFSGAIGGAVQVIVLMWLRTTVNYQCRYGVGILEALSALYKQGGISRFYQGLSYAIVQGPLARFGSVAANEGAIEFVKHFQFLKGNNLIFATALGSIFASIWRVLLMPIDTCKTVLQVEGKQGFNKMMSRVWFGGEFNLLYQGTLATMVATVVGHYPWFISHNWLDKIMSKPSALHLKLLRDAFIGFVSSAISDTVSNIVRVVKTVKQSSVTSSLKDLSYYQVILQVYKEGGLSALFGRGLLLRIMTNGLQSMLFVVIWKFIAAQLKKRDEKNNKQSRDL